MGIEYKDPSRCAACGGKCCQLYEKACKGGMMPDEIDVINDDGDETFTFNYWYRHTVWFTQKDHFGVDPLFDVLKANASFLHHFFDKSDLRKIEADQYLEALKAKGIDTGIVHIGRWRAGASSRGRIAPQLAGNGAAKHGLTKNNYETEVENNSQDL